MKQTEKANGQAKLHAQENASLQNGLEIKQCKCTVVVSTWTRNFMCLMIVLWHLSKSLADMFDAGHESVIARFCVLVCCRF